jgi:hypothetical protein
MTGLPGESGGNFYVYGSGSNLENWQVKSLGGAGCDGQDGANGKDGRAGKDAVQKPNKVSFDLFFLDMTILWSTKKAKEARIGQFTASLDSLLAIEGRKHNIINKCGARLNGKNQQSTKSSVGDNINCFYVEGQTQMDSPLQCHFMLNLAVL